MKGTKLQFFKIQTVKSIRLKMCQFYSLRIESDSRKKGEDTFVLQVDKRGGLIYSIGEKKKT